MPIQNSLGIACFIILHLYTFASWPTAASAASIEVPRISIEQTRQMLTDPEVVIIDVRTAKAWWKSPTKILNAVREELGSVEQWADKYSKDKTLVLY